MDIFFEIHQDLLREGPGDNASTQKALGLLSSLPAKPSILDVGCGPGAQSLALAGVVPGRIIAVDTHYPFLANLQAKALQGGFVDKIKPVTASMLNLPFAPGSFDLIWSEGAIYIIGFEKGFKSWRTLLRENGYLAVTELSWLGTSAPDEIRKFWSEGYPGMHIITANLEIISSAGYRILETFTLPESSWWNEYYNPLECRVTTLREKYSGNSQATFLLDETQREIDMYRKYSAFYGYVFYLAQAIPG